MLATIDCSATTFDLSHQDDDDEPDAGEYPRHRYEWRVLTISEESKLNLITQQNREKQSPLASYSRERAAVWQLARSRNRRPQEVNVLPPSVSVVAVPPALRSVCSTTLGVPVTARMQGVQDQVGQCRIW